MRSCCSLVIDFSVLTLFLSTNKYLPFFYGHSFFLSLISCLPFSRNNNPCCHGYHFIHGANRNICFLPSFSFGLLFHFFLFSLSGLPPPPTQPSYVESSSQQLSKLARSHILIYSVTSSSPNLNMWNFIMSLQDFAMF